MTLKTPTHTAPSRKPIYRSLYFQVLVGVMLGIVVGHFWPAQGAALKPLGDAFVRLVKMMIAPIVFCTIALGIANMNDMKQVGKTMAKAMGLFYALTLIALLTGLAAVMLIQPGVGMNVNPALLDAGVAAKYMKSGAPSGFVEFLLHIIPHTFFGAFAEGEVLPVLFLAILVGFGLARTGADGKAAHTAIESFSHVLFNVFGFLMKLAPLAAFGAMSFTVGKYGIKSISSLGLLIGTFYTACILFVVIVLGTLAKLHGFSLYKLLRYFREELLVVLGTSSTEPVLPRMLMKLEKLGCRKSVSGLVLPLGYSFNLDGTAIYLTLASVFIAQACNIHLEITQILAMLAVMLLSSKGAAGVTGSGFVALVATLTVMPEIPVAGVALIVGIDRFMSEARALTSLVSNAVASVVVSLWEGACDRTTLQRELTQGFDGTVAAPAEAAVPHNVALHAAG
ncbi:C4-dicarboxylate transporter DctA [Duganella sp. FT92W]|uniref:C4-dicarboxylate transporter DctA n=1 Tax=Pseudoduganella rivuli TaxID=2666085 RepID=A0A7X2IMK7_9BURK|nr:C4-dicarboxylate transporter DctA [Pseudoduganella rivuli]